jgi:hypothetical protein
MRKIPAICFASLLGLGSFSAQALDLNNDERSELRERAQHLQSERERNPGWDGGVRRVNESRGDVNLNRNRGDVKLNQNRGEVKPKSANGTKRKREPAKDKVKRGLKSVPGALVRNR